MASCTLYSAIIRVVSIGAIAIVFSVEVVLWWEGPLQEAPLYYVMTLLLWHSPFFFLGKVEHGF